MNQNPENRTTYRFAAFGARGTITLAADRVHIRTLSYLGWWEQTIPLEHLSPSYAVLVATPPIYVWAWILATIFVFAGVYGFVWGAAQYPQKLVGVFLLTFGAWFAWYLYTHRKTEWIMFPACAGYGVNYTRQGPDERRCDDFTRQMVELIKANPPPQKSRTTP